MEYPQRIKKINISSKELLINEPSLVSHDGVVSASQKKIIDNEFENAIIISKKVMEELAIKIEEDGGVIGHMKAFLKSGNASGRLSLTSKKADIIYKGSSALKKCEIDFNLILLNVNEEKTKAYASEFFENIKKDQ